MIDNSLSTVLYKFDIQHQYIKSNFEHPVWRNILNSRDRMSDEMLTALQYWQPKSSRDKAIKIAAVKRLLGCIDLLDGPCQSENFKPQIQIILIELQKVRDTLCGY